MNYIILAITAIASSRAMLAFFNDPEGPNLLIVLVLAAVVYAVSLGTYFALSKQQGIARLLLAILVQILIVTGLYFLGR